MSSPKLLAMRWEARLPWKASGPGAPGAQCSVPRGYLRYGGLDFSDGQSYGWLNSSYLADPDPPLIDEAKLGQFGSNVAQRALMAFR